MSLNFSCKVNVTRLMLPTGVSSVRLYVGVRHVSPTSRAKNKLHRIQKNQLDTNLSRSFQVVAIERVEYEA